MSKHNKMPYTEIALPINNTFSNMYSKKGFISTMHCSETVFGWPNTSFGGLHCFCVNKIEIKRWKITCEGGYHGDERDNQ